MTNLVERHRHLKEAVEATLRETTGFDGLAESVLTQVVIHTINSYQQKVGVGVQDSVSDLIETFKQKVSEAVFEASRGWRLANRDCFLLPRDCRFCFSKGGSTVVVVEQEPQVRTVMFENSNMLDSVLLPNDETLGERVSLAFPYVYFVVHFKEGRFTNLYSGWRNRPLSSLDDFLAAPLLPNIHDNMNVCVGRDLDASGAHLSEQTGKVISHFWNSRFNNDLSSRWWGKGALSHSLSSARVWAARSANDPTFILGMDFISSPIANAKTVRSLLELLTMHEEEPDENSLRHKLSEAIDESAESLFLKIIRYFKKTKFDKYHPKDIKEKLAESMKAAAGELADLILLTKLEVDKLKSEIADHKQPPRVTGCGPFWEDYST